MPDDVVVRRQAAGSRMLGVVLAAGSDVSRDPALLELLAVRFEQQRPKRSNSPGRGWGLMMRKNSDRDSAASIPKRVLKKLQEDQKYREEEEQLLQQQEQLGLLPDGNVALAQGAPGEADDGGAAVTQERVLDMWGVYKKNEMDDRQFNFCAALSYFIFWVLLMMQAAKAPNAVGLMKHQDAIIDLVLDEEFPDVSFKKNHFDIMTEDELWQWVDGPLTAAFYPDDSSEIPQPLLYSNLLIGSIQLRQVRVRDTECTHLIHDLDPWPGLFGDREDNTAGRCSPRWNADEEDLRPYGGLDGQKYQSTTFASGLKGPKTMAMSTVGDSASEDFGTTGYAVTLPRRRTDFINRTLALREEGAPFVDGRTRMLTFSFNLINGNDMSMPPAKWSPVDVPRQDVTHVLAVQISFVLDSTGHWCAERGILDWQSLINH